MSTAQELRAALAEADRERRLADAAESARRSIRLGYSPKAHERKRFWFGVDEQTFTPAQTRAIYEALGVVMRDHQQRAAAIEAGLDGSAS